MIALSSQTGQLNQGERTIYTFSPIKLERLLETIGDLPFAIRTSSSTFINVQVGHL